jgi:hypothetical protein
MPDGTLAAVEVKTGRYARLSPNQKLLLPELERLGGIPVGRRAAAARFRVGEPLPGGSLKMFVMRPEGPLVPILKALKEGF